MTNTTQTLQITSNKKQATLALVDGIFSVKNNSQCLKLSVPVQRVLWAECSPASSQVTVHVLAKEKRTKISRLLKIEGSLTEQDLEQGKRWAQALMDAAYAGIEQRRRLRVFVNPHAGPGKARSLFRKRIEPVLLAAKCTLDVTYTTHSAHALSLAQEIPLNTYDAVLVVSGDGMAHEVFNGFATHKEDPMRALESLPIVPVPAGSGNGLSLNLNGLEEGLDVAVATLTAIKGRPMPVDLFSILTRKDNKRSLSFMSQCVGLMADLDLGTEHLRFLGATRFVYGYLRGVLTQKKCPVSISIKTIESDKEKMFDAFRSATSTAAPTDPSTASPVSAPGSSSHHQDESADPISNGHPPEGPGVAAEGGEGRSSSLPPMKYNFENAEGDGWVKFEKGICYVYAGKGPYVSRDFMQFPISLPNDGAIDVVIQEPGSRGEMLRWMDGADAGKCYWQPNCHYYKAAAYRITPHPPASSHPSTSAPAAAEPSNGVDHPKTTSTHKRSHSIARSHKRPTPSLGPKHTNAAPHSVPEGNLSVDGERFPYDEFLVEVHPGLGRFLSLWGGYRADFKRE